MSGILYIVPTPVGNMDDMTPRAVEVLKSVDRILAEDTRTSAPLLHRFGVTTPISSHHKYNEHDTAETVARQISDGMNIALISDAGTPGISDPGFMLSRACAAIGVEVITLPGPTAFVPALVDSALPCDRFAFEGFLPPQKGRATRIAEIAARTVTTIIYESPKRLVKTLEQLAAACGSDRPASVSREISKLHETTIRGTIGDLVEFFTTNPPRGEIVIVIGGNRDDSKPKVHRNKYRDCED